MEGEWLFLTTYAMVCKIQRHPYFFPAMCHCLYRFIVAGYATYLQRVLLYSFLVILSMFMVFWSYGVNGIRNGMGASLFILAMTYVNRPPVMIGLCVLAAGIHKSIYLMVGAGTLTWFIKNSYWYLAGWMACVGVSYAIGGRIQAYLAAKQIWWGDDRFSGYLTGDNMVGEIVQMSMWLSAGTFCYIVPWGVAVGTISSSAATSRDEVLPLIYNTFLVTNAFLLVRWDPCCLFQPFRPDFVVHHAGGIDLSVHEGTFWVNHEKCWATCC